MDPAGPRSRAWSDSELREAVASAHSWRGVLRALGLTATSAGAIRGVKRHAARLELDTAHFTGQRQWSDQQLKKAVALAVSWADVFEALGITDRGESRFRVKGHAVRLGLDTTHLSPRPDRHIAAAKAFNAEPDLCALRGAAQAIAMAWLSMRGMPVAMPTEPQSYDLLVTTPDGIQRVQVKSTTHRGRDGKWLVGVGHRPYSLDKTARKEPYDPDGLDFFFVVTGDGGLFVIPSDALAGRTTVCVDSYDGYRVGDASSLMANLPGPSEVGKDEFGSAAGFATHP